MRHDSSSLISSLQIFSSRGSPLSFCFYFLISYFYFPFSSFSPACRCFSFTRLSETCVYLPTLKNLTLRPIHTYLQLYEPVLVQSLQRCTPHSGWYQPLASLPWLLPHSRPSTKTPSPPKAWSFWQSTSTCWQARFKRADSQEKLQLVTCPRSCHLSVCLYCHVQLPRLNPQRLT